LDLFLIHAKALWEILQFCTGARRKRSRFFHFHEDWVNRPEKTSAQISGMEHLAAFSGLISYDGEKKPAGMATAQ
jgi:hypothetical protein